MLSKDQRVKFIMLIIVYGWLGPCIFVFAQTPIITVRCANPQTNCLTYEYCVDVEFRSSIPDQEIFGMNVRFFYDDSILEFVDFRDFEGGYGPAPPDPPIVFTSEPAGPALFNFNGAAEFINGGMQLVNANAPPILLDSINWVKIFQMCFLVDDPTSNPDTFCPAIVWDLEQDPANGGFLAGDDGVVISMVDPDPENESFPADENVVQYNWEYTGNGEAPYGQPVEITCYNINCILPLTLVSFTGYAAEKGNRLEWQTIHEINVDGFVVQRTIGGGHLWQALGFVQGAGTSPDQQHYTFMDYFPHWGVNFYRLEQRDLDGKVSFSPIIRVDATQKVKEKEIIVFPNPARGGTITVQLGQNTKEFNTIYLFDPEGQLLRKGVVHDSFGQITSQGLLPGIYLICANTGIDYICEKIIIY